MCPNCYLGYTELGHAIREAKEKRLPLTYQIQYHPARLVCTEALADGVVVDKHEFLENKFGKERFAAFKDSINIWAEKKNLSMQVLTLLR